MKVKVAKIIALTIIGVGVSTGFASASVTKYDAADITANSVMADDDTGWVAPADTGW